MIKHNDDSMSTGKIVAIGLVGAIVLGGIGYATWEINWARKTANTNRDAALSRENQGYQLARVDEINRKMADLAGLKALEKSGQLDDQALGANKAQQMAVTGIICGDYRTLTPTIKGTLDTDLVNTLQVLCQP